MKVGILTFHKAVNYGAILQAYALHKALENEQIDNEIVDYTNNKIDNNYKLFTHKSMKRFISDICYSYIKIKKKRKFNCFMREHIKLSKECKSYEDLKKIDNEYDAFITGSDQVWNYKHTGMDKGYFLNFTSENRKKNSYAASFGIDEIPKEQKEEYYEMLKDFNNISVRENGGKKIIKDLLQKECSVNIDPSFLIPKEEWRRILKKPKEKDYILIFVMQKNKTIFEFAEKLAKEKNLEIIYISDSFKKRIKGKYKYTLSPTEWLGYFFNAKYIITNSFHGLAFSLILNKNFFVELQKPPATGNARLEQLIELFKVQDRKIINGRNENINSDINWGYINNIIESEKNKSLLYLEAIINGGKND